MVLVLENIVPLSPVIYLSVNAPKPCVIVPSRQSKLSLINFPSFPLSQLPVGVTSSATPL